MSNLFSVFNEVRKSEWKEKINTDLKGGDYNEKLISLSEGIKILPIYHADDKIKTYNCNFPSEWEIYQLIDATDAKQANKRALTSLQNNVSGLCFSNPNNLDILLNDIAIEHIRIDFTNYSDEFQKVWQEYAKGKSVQGAFHGITTAVIPNYLDTIFAEGGTSKEQIHNAFNKGVKTEKKVQFHFEIGSNYFLEIAKIKAFDCRIQFMPIFVHQIYSK